LKRCGKNYKNLHHVDCKILSFEVAKIIFGGLAKNRATTLHKVTFA